MGSFGPSNLTPDTAITIGGITCWDEDSAGGEYSLAGKSYEERKIIVGADDFAKLVNVLLVPAPVTLGGQFYPQPYAHPRAPWLRILSIGLPELIPTQVGLTQQFYTATDGTEQSLVFGNFYRCVLRYGQLDYQAFDTGDLEYSFSTKQVAFPNIALYYGSSQQTSAPYIVDVPVGQLYFTRKQQLSIPATTIFSCIASPLNSVAFPLSNGGQNTGVTLPIGSVKYNGVETNYANQGSGSPQWTTRHVFEYYSPGWNTIPNPAPTSISTMSDLFVAAFTDSGHSHPFPYASSNINVLLT